MLVFRGVTLPKFRVIRPSFSEGAPITDSLGGLGITCMSHGTKVHMGVSKNNGTPKWMVKIMENPIKMG